MVIDEMMEFYELEGKTIIAISRVLKKSEAITLANVYFKAKKDRLRVRQGHINGDVLEICDKGDVWVISRRCKHE